MSNTTSAPVYYIRDEDGEMSIGRAQKATSMYVEQMLFASLCNAQSHRTAMARIGRAFRTAASTILARTKKCKVER
jgi:hypothetical protein